MHMYSRDDVSLYNVLSRVLHERGGFLDFLLFSCRKNSVHSMLHFGSWLQSTPRTPKRNLTLIPPLLAHTCPLHVVQECQARSYLTGSRIATLLASDLMESHLLLPDLTQYVECEEAAMGHLGPERRRSRPEQLRESCTNLYVSPFSIAPSIKDHLKQSAELSSLKGRQSRGKTHRQKRRIRQCSPQ